MEARWTQEKAEAEERFLALMDEARRSWKAEKVLLLGRPPSPLPSLPAPEDKRAPGGICRRKSTAGGRSGSSRPKGLGATRGLPWRQHGRRG